MIIFFIDREWEIIDSWILAKKFSMMACKLCIDFFKDGNKYLDG